MPGKTLLWIMICSLFIYGAASEMSHFSRSDYRDQMRRLQEFKASLAGSDSVSFVAPSSASPAPSPNPSQSPPVIQELYVYKYIYFLVVFVGSFLGVLQIVYM